MVNYSILEKINHLEENLKEELEKITSHYNDDCMGMAEVSLMKVDESVSKLKEMIVDYEFESLADEVYFFKHVKPSFISYFIYYSKILNIEAFKPTAGDKTLRKYYENELEKLKVFYSENTDFYSYYRRNATYMDHKYFVRNSYDMKMKLSLSFYNFDFRFTTSHDQLISNMMANKKLEDYLNEKINEIGTGLIEKTAFKSPLSWSSSKVALIELIYGIHLMRCFNGGNIELSEIIRTFEKTMDINLGNFHKILGEIRLRKTGRTKFLQNLQENLEQHFIDLDQ